METAVKRLARGAYQIGTGGGARGRQVNYSPATYSISRSSFEGLFADRGREFLSRAHQRIG